MDQVYDKPVPRNPRSAEKLAQLRVQNRRRTYIEQHPSYFESSEHELADPVLFERLVKKFQTPAERAADGKAKGYGLTLEADLVRGETKLANAEIESTHVGSNGNEDEPKLEDSAWDRAAADKADGRELWNTYLTERFINGQDEDFDYSKVDNEEAYDAMERRDEEENWFDEEEPSWVDDGNKGRGETGVQDF